MFANQCGVIFRVQSFLCFYFTYGYARGDSGWWKVRERILGRGQWIFGLLILSLQELGELVVNGLVDV